MVVSWRVHRIGGGVWIPVLVAMESPYMPVRISNGGYVTLIIGVVRIIRGYFLVLLAPGAYYVLQIATVTGVILVPGFLPLVVGYLLDVVRRVVVIGGIPVHRFRG